LFFGVKVGTSGDQGLKRLEAPTEPHRLKQRCSALPALVWVCAMFEQQLDDPGMALARCRQERGFLENPTDLLKLRTFKQGSPDSFRFAINAGIE
jgi:hypothetical protein